MTNEISEYDDVIDSRDVIARIAELESERDDVMDDGDHDAIVGWQQAYGDELDDLRAFASEGSDYCEDWEYGEALIRDSYFTTHARELAEDIGAIDSDAKWPATCIDWEAAANDLRSDYTALTFRGVTYWAR